MGKEKVKKGVTNKHLHARIAYLEKAAKYLTEQAQVQAQSKASNAGEAPRPFATEATSEGEPMDVDRTQPESDVFMQSAFTGSNQKKPLAFSKSTAGGLPILYTSQLQSIARKGQIRLAQEVKRCICKTCSAPLVDGTTATRYTENLSKGGDKPWAEVLVVKCNACGTAKRFPVGARRQRRRKDREAELGTYGDDGRVAVKGDEVDVVAGGAMEVMVPPRKCGD